MRHSPEGCVGLTVVGGLELCRRNHPDLAVQAAVVEPVDVGERRPFQVVGALPGSTPVDQFRLEQTVEALGEGIEAPIDVKWFYASGTSSIGALGAGSSP